jgi:hypothetical protein
MYRKLVVILTSLIIGSVAFVAYAGNVHFVGNLFTSSGSFVVEGDAVGLGNGAFTFHLTAYGEGIALCQNKGGNIAPGQKPIKVSSATFDTFTSSSNGRTHVYLRAPDPGTVPLTDAPSAKKAGCPNGNWRVIGVAPNSTYWKSAVLNVTNAATNAQVLQVSWTCFGSPESCIQN